MNTDEALATTIDSQSLDQLRLLRTELRETYDRLVIASWDGAPGPSEALRQLQRVVQRRIRVLEGQQLHDRRTETVRPDC